VFESFSEQLLRSKVGHIGQYSGTQGILSRVHEKRLETVVWANDIPEVLARMKELHPSEEVAYDLIPLNNPGRVLGLGRYGVIDPKQKFGFPMPIPGVYKGDIRDQKIFAKIGVCGGNVKMVDDAIRLGLDLLIGAEFGFHDELLAAEQGLTLLDLGHDASERPILIPLAKLIQNQFPSVMVQVETV
jgi:putative NIF3 family GTP cyclohydrolase 1 type 2